MEKFVTYEGLPISSGGAHSLGNKKPRDIYESTLQFLRTYSDIDYPTKISIILYKDASFDYKTIKRQLHKDFGLFSKTSSWDFNTHKQKFWTWDLSLKNIDRTLTILEQWKDLPELDYGPLSLSILWNFKLVDPTSRLKLPNQELIPILDPLIHNSRILLTLQRKSSISVWFAFP